MTPLEFVQKYQGKKIDYDGAYGPQCVDVFRQYCKEVVKCPHTGAVEGAKDLWERFSLNDEKKYFVRLNATKGRIGDVIIWGSTPSNRYGHVAIIVTRMGNNVLVFEQDGFRLDGCKLAIRDITSALGVLRAAREGGV